MLLSGALVSMATHCVIWVPRPLQYTPRRPRVAHVSRFIMCDQLQDKSFSWERRFKIAVYKWKTRDNTRDSQTIGLCVLKWLTDSVTNLYKSKIDKYV